MPYPLPTIPGVPDATWSNGSLVTIVSFASSSGTFQADADALVTSLRSANVFLGQTRLEVLYPPPAPAPSTLEITQNAVGAWVSLAAGLSIVTGTLISIFQCRSQARKNKLSEQAASTKPMVSQQSQQQAPMSIVQQAPPPMFTQQPPPGVGLWVKPGAPSDTKRVRLAVL